MNSLDFIVTLGDETLTMRDATAKCIYQKHGMAVPEILKDVVVTHFLGRLRRAPSARAFGPGLRPLLAIAYATSGTRIICKKVTAFAWCLEEEDRRWWWSRPGGGGGGDGGDGCGRSRVVSTVG